MARYDVTREELAGLLEGEPRYRVQQVWEGLYRHGTPPEALTTLPVRLRARLADEPALAPSLWPDVEAASDGGATLKWRWQLADGRRIETVLMHYGNRSTTCVSSQAGCAMGCGFCATGQAGFDRNLTVGEIVEQVVRAAAEATARGGRVSNVVFMGMGEPMANYEQVWAAVERLHADLGLSARHITVSTVGIVPGIRRLAGERLPVNLAVSLHAADDALRDRLVPVNRRYPLDALTEACRDYLARTGRRLSFEWALIEGVNDGLDQLDRLAFLARLLRAHVNLIPLNPTPGYPAHGTAPAGVAAFRDGLLERGVNATVRHNRGTDIGAACGQLAAR
ncbi:MAG TPA: 23S rRNA (adenine(2503)-C(2))-methyltransferase RlmN [Acidimicrobiales bacterium]|nr:23S rRNA (adenine(2503)-C(2))-methyltransferase RlmN [Acidimicrobiales bacterium]